jgi:diguanylate cyclase (GGDEF)-like protein
MGPASDAAPSCTPAAPTGSSSRGAIRHASALDALLRLQNEVLEAVASGEALATVADRLCRRVEAIVPGVIATVLTVDESGRLHPLAAPSIAEGYSAALEGVAIGPCVGSCGTSAFRGEAVEVTDIATDPLWADYRALALSYGLAACWSTPIKARDGRVIGTFAFYYRTIRGAQEEERQVVKACVHLCAIAIEHDEVRARNHRLAYYDTLSGLPNRSHFKQLLDERFAAPDPAFGLILFDIDHLKIVNDTMGHAVGDALISVLAARLTAAKLPGIICRIGGDEFAVIIDKCPSPAAMRAVARRILRLVDLPIVCDGQTVPFRVTMGGALSGVDGPDVDAICQSADLALDHAKRTQRGSYVYFRSELRTATVNRARAVRAVGVALQQGRIVPYYQPVVRLDTGTLVSLEALARMQADDGTIVPASDFHLALSDPKVAYDLTGRMLTQVVADLRAWRAAGLEVPPVAVNLSTADFQRGDLAGRLTRVFAKAGVPLDRLILEVTETAMMDSEGDVVAKAVAALRARGLSVALDDFGTGFASLTHLLHFPVDVIKIDKTFVDRVLVDRPSAAIVEAMIGIAHRLKMKVVAEGIEERAQAERLKSLGCTLGQGYLFARPASAETIRASLATTAAAAR